MIFADLGGPAGAFMPRRNGRLGALGADIAGASGDHDKCHDGGVRLDEDEIGIFCTPAALSGTNAI